MKLILVEIYKPSGQEHFVIMSVIAEILVPLSKLKMLCLDPGASKINDIYFELL